MRELEVLDQGHLKLTWEERKEFFEEELGEHVRSEVKRLLEEALEAERTDWLGVGRYVRDEAGRQDYRNGYYRRDLGTRLGLLRRLRVPRTRRGCRSQLLGRYQRRQESVHELVREAFLRGISTRQVGEVLEPILGEAYSAQTVSRIVQGLDRAVAAYHRRRLGDEYVYLFLDGVVLKVRDARGQVRRRVVLVAYGITRRGRRELIGYRLAAGESEVAWTAFLQDFFQRGFEGRRLRLITTDGSTGLQAALALVFPHVPQQRCWAHKLRNIADKVPKKEGSCVREAAAIYQADSRRAGPARLPRLGGEVAAAASPRRGQPGARLGGTAQLLRRSPRRTGARCAPPMSLNAVSGKSDAALDPSPASPTRPAATGSSSASSVT